MEYVCSNCGNPAYYDGRCGDGPVLVCECSKRKRWINDGRGGFEVYENNARPIAKNNFWRKDKR